MRASSFVRVRPSASAASWSADFSGSVVMASEYDEAAWMRTAVAEAAKTRNAATYEVRLTTSYAEVRAIDAVRAPDDADVTCLTDALWELEFPPGRAEIVVHHIASTAK